MASPARTSVRGLEPGPALVGTARVPGSKSIAQRALLAAALAQGTTRFASLPPGEDVLAAAGLAARLAQLEPGQGTASLFAAESGTLARLALATLALGTVGPDPFELAVGGTLRRRRSAPLIESLRAAGAQIECSTADGGWPLRVTPAKRVPERLWLMSPVSSQEASGICLALAALGGEHTLEISGRLPSRPYLELTLGVLADFGVSCEIGGLEGDRGHVTVRGGLTAPSEPYPIETDASLAAVMLAAGIASGGKIEVEGVAEGSRQGDARVTEYLTALGFPAARDGARLIAGNGLPFARGGKPGPAVTLDLWDVPDLAPVLIALTAAVRPGRATFVGLETLDHKESPRLTGLARGLTALGLEVEAGPDRLTLTGPLVPGGADGGAPENGPWDAIELDCSGDHRMAFAWSLIGLTRPGVRLAGADCVGKSWPDYFEELDRLGAQVVR